jgi:hypothetical protein
LDPAHRFTSRKKNLCDHLDGRPLMARAFGRILSRIWDDRDFLALDASPQRLYCFLVSQSNLNHAGLLPMTLRKWAKKAADLTPERVRRDLAVLDAARFVVVDEDSEEVLIRTFIRNDDVYKAPRVMGAAVSGALEIESHRLRRALLAEASRIPLEELSDEPSKLKDGRSGPSIRAQIAGHINDLCSAFVNLDPDPGQGPAEPLGEPLGEDLPHEGHEWGTEGVPEGVAEPLPEGVAEGVLEGVVLPPAQPLHEGDPEGVRGYARARGSAPTRVSPSPSPSPDPFPIPFGASGGGGEPPRAQPLLALVEGGAVAVIEDRPQTADQLIAYWIDNVPKRPPGQVIGRVGKSIKAMLAEGIEPADIAAGLEAWATRGKDPAVLPSIVNEVMNAGGADRIRGNRPAPGDELGGDAHMSRYLARVAVRKAREA